MVQEADPVDEDETEVSAGPDMLQVLPGVRGSVDDHGEAVVDHREGQYEGIDGSILENKQSYQTQR